MVDDQPIFRNLTKSVLEQDVAYEVTGEAIDDMHTLEIMSKLNPDIVVMDVQIGHNERFRDGKHNSINRPAHCSCADFNETGRLIREPYFRSRSNSVLPETPPRRRGIVHAYREASPAGFGLPRR